MVANLVTCLLFPPGGLLLLPDQRYIEKPDKNECDFNEIECINCGRVGSVEDQIERSFLK